MKSNGKKGRTLTNENNLPEPIVKALESDYTYKPNQYSATSILGGLTETMLKRRHNTDIVEDVSDLIYALLGTASHSVLEKAEPDLPSYEMEGRIEEPIVVEDGTEYILSGYYDYYDSERKVVGDWKTTSVWTVVNKNYDDHHKQLMIYAWALVKQGKEVKGLENVYILRDWSKMEKMRNGRNYPNRQVHVVKYDFTQEDFEKIDKFIYERFEEIHKLEVQFKPFANEVEALLKMPNIHEKTKLEPEYTNFEQARERKIDGVLEQADALLEPCSPEDRWNKPDTFAVTKKGNKRASRVLDSLEEAEKWRADSGFEETHVIERRKGSNNKCENYCSVNQWCPFYKENYGVENE